MAAGQFALSLKAFADKSKVDLDTVVRTVVLSIGAGLVERSPVGNPELWAANKHAEYGRNHLNAFVDLINADLEPGEKPVRKLSARTLKKNYPLVSGKGYVGGRFRANWQLTAGTPASGNLDAVDPRGTVTLAKFKKLTEAMRAGGLIFYANNLPYGPRLEYEGWSKQAPAGMVGITLVETQGYVTQAVQAL